MPRDVEVYLSQETAARVMEALRWVEGQRGTTVPGRSDARPNNSHYFALVTTAITAGNMAASPPVLGKGKVTLLYISDDGTTAKLLPMDGQTGLTAYNGGASIAANRVVQVKFASGGLVVDVDYC